MKHSSGEPVWRIRMRIYSHFSAAMYIFQFRIIKNKKLKCLLYKVSLRDVRFLTLLQVGRYRYYKSGGLGSRSFLNVKYWYRYSSACSKCKFEFSFIPALLFLLTSIGYLVSVCSISNQHGLPRFFTSGKFHFIVLSLLYLTIWTPQCWSFCFGQLQETQIGGKERHNSGKM